jgi:biotin carboxyl carrier protein
MNEQHNNIKGKADVEIKYDSFELDDFHYDTFLTHTFKNRVAYQAANPKKITAFIPGKIKKVHVRRNSRVKEGDILVVLEAMKMNNNIFSPVKATIKEVYVTQGLSVAKGALLVEFK